MTREQRYENEEVARRGAEMYQRQVKPQMQPSDKGKVVALDIDSGEFEVADDSLTACQRLRERRPDAQIWCERVGFLAVRRFGGRPIPEDA
jgi:hypothetical protein